MKHVILLVLISVWLMGCGQIADTVGSIPGALLPGPGRRVGTQDPEFAKYIDMYQSAYGRDISGQTIVMRDTLEALPGVGPSTVGFCLNGQNEIHVLMSAWNRVSDLTKQMILFHELGHCDMGEPHRDARYSADFCPVSLMNANITSDDCYSRHYSSYLGELSANRAK